MNTEDSNNEQSGILKKITNPIQGFKIASVDRFSNPIFYSFIISWCLFNWDRIAVLVLSKQNIVDRVISVKDMPSNSTILLDIPYANTIIFPIISTLFLVVLSPFINNWLYNIHKSQIVKRIINQEKLNADSYDAQILSIEARVKRDAAEEVKMLESQENKAAIIARTVESEANITNLKEQHAELTNYIHNLQNSRDELIKESNRLVNYNAELTLKNTNLIDDISSKNKEIEDLNKTTGDARKQKERITQLQNTINYNDEAIVKYKKQAEDSKFLLNALLEYFENPPRDDNGIVIDNDFNERIYDHIKKYGLYTSTS
ncbi:TPA: hypothetical protein MFC71_001979 [Klebsiella pneumoniae]|uniref:hypothetical protein n=1 Tax=Klebsiella pneumoniae complex TaxID=3390273 RepID=UPI00081C24BA|nr:MULTISPECIES: hypothetical protein [Klebsiella]MCP6432714.1 hypothetical protein [Klebsiella pneumoniae]OCU27909.1 hypothetical protein A6D87_00595 [Klebsiella quasipneumoniae]HBR1525608.1 hypothetical protein [Klebsiella pneumoniae]HBW7246979.1 hypothetical protein [Klebsiella pneumoniae]